MFNCKVIQDDIAQQAIQKVPLEEFVGVHVLIYPPEFPQGVWVEIEGTEEYVELIGVSNCGSKIGFFRTDIQQIFIPE